MANSQNSNKFLSFILKPNIIKPKPLLLKIYKKLKIFAPTKLKIPVKEYYKFPYFDNIKSKSNVYFVDLFGEFVKAMGSVYYKYENEKSFFAIKIGINEIFFREKVIGSLYFKEMFIENGIGFSEEKEEGGDWLVVNEEDVFLILDLLFNLPICESSVIPFILSEGSFENGVFFSTKVVEYEQIQSKGVLHYHYEVLEYFYGKDYEEYFKYQTSVYE